MNLMTCASRYASEAQRLTLDTGQTCVCVEGCIYVCLCAWSIKSWSIIVVKKKETFELHTFVTT